MIQLELFSYEVLEDVLILSSDEQDIRKSLRKLEEYMEEIQLEEVEK